MLEGIFDVVAIALVISFLLFSHLSLHGKSVRDLFKWDFSRPVHLDAKQERTSLFCLENSRLFGDDVQHCIITHALVDEGYVDSGRQLLVDIHQLFHQEWPLVFKTYKAIRDLAEAIDKVWSGQIAIVNWLGDSLSLELRLPLTTHLTYLVVCTLQDVVLS